MGFELYCDGNHENSCFGTANRDDFISKIAHGISTALNVLYSNEKQEKNQVLSWQDEQDKKREFFEIFKRFQKNN